MLTVFKPYMAVASCQGPAAVSLLRIVDDKPQIPHRQSGLGSALTHKAQDVSAGH
jgi:hypothetical protein